VAGSSSSSSGPSSPSFELIELLLVVQLLELLLLLELVELLVVQLLVRLVPLRGAATLLRRALADREAVGEQDLVGRGAQVGPEVPARRVLEDRSRQVLDQRRDLGRGRKAVLRRGGLAAPQLALQGEGAVHDGLRLATALGLRAERRDAHG
jgi:hypothetical protein